MARSTKHLRTPFSAYLRRDITEFDEELCRVGRGTPCGEYLRRFWQPICPEDELGDVPRAIRILGEDLVVFRDGSGRIGLLERRCTHRGASLEFGKIVERGIAEPLELVILYKSGFAASLDVFVTRNAENNAFG